MCPPNASFDFYESQSKAFRWLLAYFFSFSLTFYRVCWYQCLSFVPLLFNSAHWAHTIFRELRLESQATPRLCDIETNWWQCTDCFEPYQIQSDFCSNSNSLLLVRQQGIGVGNGTHRTLQHHSNRNAIRNFYFDSLFAAFDFSL